MDDRAPASGEESLRDFVARNRAMPKEQALRLVLDMPKVRAWIGADAGRRDRLTREFDRLWSEFSPTPQPSLVRPPQPHLGPGHLHVDERLVPEDPRPVKVVRSRRENFMCTSCGGIDIHSETDGESVRVRCHACKKEFKDILELIPVVQVGPLELFFGRGREAAIKGGALVLLWAVVFLVLRSLA